MNALPRELRPNRYDALVALAVLVCALLLGAHLRFPRAQTDDLTVTVTIDAQTVETSPLLSYAATEHTYSNNAYTLTVRAADGALFVVRSDCPSQDCVHTGTISRAGQSIVCLPARITIRLTGAADSYDLITG